MLRKASLLTLALATSNACSPEVIIATDWAVVGGAAGISGSAGNGVFPAAGAPTAGNGTSGSGGLPGGSGGGDASGDGMGGSPDVVEPARLLADSVADFTLTQGTHGWYYGTDSGSVDTFTLMTRKSVITAYEPVTKDEWTCWASDTSHWAQIFQLGAHPNGVDSSPPSTRVLERAVRRWVSNFEGNVVVSGEAAKIDLIDSNGVDVLVYVDGVQHFNKLIAGDDGGGLSYEFRAAVHVGSSVDFVLDPHASSDHHDLSRFTGIIARDDEQAE